MGGDGEMRGELETLIVRHDLQNMVRITGWISSDQVRDEILAARALVLPSFAEGLPVVIMEAMALRRPVISTYVTGIPELINPGRARVAGAGRGCRGFGLRNADLPRYTR
jgi:colanic acid/amylovoran biosynthesis glycosyltransferase